MIDTWLILLYCFLFALPRGQGLWNAQRQTGYPFIKNQSGWSHYPSHLSFYSPTSTTRMFYISVMFWIFACPPPTHTHTANFKIFLSKSFLLKSILCFVLWESLLPCWTFIADMFFNLHPYSSQWLFLHRVFVSEEYLSVENVPPGLAAKSNLYWSLAKPICSASLDGHFVLNTICG